MEMIAEAVSKDCELDGWPFAGVSAASLRLRTQVQRIAPHYRTALLIGEAGTGKTEVARALHRLSPVAAGALVICPADQLSDQLLIEAARGTLLLTHIERLRPDAQAEVCSRLSGLDRELRNHTAETRLLCASECDLRGMVAAGRMREDLARRISALEVRVPALRERLEDLPALLAGSPVTDEAMEQMLSHAWPGNLRELSALIERAGSGEIDGESLATLPQPTPAAGDSDEVTLDAVLRRHVADVLERCAGNKLRAAERLGISRSTLYRMLENGIS